MTRSLIGLNVAGDGGAVDFDACATFVRQLRSAYVVVINSPRLAQMCMDAGATCIYRRKVEGDDDDFPTLAGDPLEVQAHAQQFVANRHAEAPPGALLYLTNEAGHGAEDLLNQWTLYALDAVATVGRKACILNLSEGTPKPERWPLLYPCIRRNHALGGVLGHHDYFSDDLADAKRWHALRWVTPKQALPETRVVVTEFGFDRNYAQVGWQRAGLSEDAYADLCAAMLSEYARYNAAVCVYSFNVW